MRLNKLILIIFIALLSFIALPISPLSAQGDFQQPIEPPKEETLEATVVEILEEKEIIPEFSEEKQL